MAKRPRRAPRTRTINAFGAVIAAVLSIVAIVIVSMVFDASAKSEEAHRRYASCAAATSDLLIASDYLTTQSRLYVLTGDADYLNNYIGEIFRTDRRNAAVQTLKHEIDGSDAYLTLTTANRLSNDLTHLELYAMRLVADATDLSPQPEEILRVIVGKDDRALDHEHKWERAEQIILSDGYQHRKERIVQSVKLCNNELVELIQAEEKASQEHLNDLLAALRLIIVALLAIVVLNMVINIQLVLLPMLGYVESIRHGKELTPVGALETRYVAEAYNLMYEENRNRTMLLQQEAEHDALTGLLNRRTFDRMLSQLEGSIALLLVDVDLFKRFNDEYGHEAGDAVLKRVASALVGTFRESDLACRIGGDEFAVIVTDALPLSRETLGKKLEGLARRLSQVEDGVPAITLSIGVAYSTDVAKRGELFNAADKALYEVKENGRNGFGFYG